MSGIKVIYEDIATGAREDGTYSTNGCKSYADATDLIQDSNVTPNYALCLPRYSKMDGTFINAPSSLAWPGVVSNYVSGSDGCFGTAPRLTVTFTEAISCVGIGLRFNELAGDYCSEVTIGWYNGETLLDECDFSPNSVNYFCSLKVNNFNKVIITFYATSKPYRYAFLSQIDFGLLREYSESNSKNHVCLMEVSQISEVLSINTFDFTAISNNGVDYMFQDKQKFHLYFNDTLLGDFYLKDGYQSAKDAYTIKTYDCVGILDGLTYYGGMLSSVTVENQIADIMNGTGISYEIDNTLKPLTLSGYMPISSKREALAHIAFVIGAMIDTSFSNKLKFYPIPTTLSNTLVNSEICSTPQLGYKSKITGLDVVCYKYKSVTDSVTLFDDTLNGTALVKFNSPMHDLSITGGTIVSSNANYATISGTGSNVVLTGQKYEELTSVMQYRNSNARGSENVPVIESATLVNSSNGQSVLNRVKAYYENAQYVTAAIELGDRQPGQKITIPTGYGYSKTGILQKATLRFGHSFIKANVEVR